MPRRSTESEVYCRVRALRLAVGLTQAELCERADITRQTLSTIETGRNLPNMGVALRLAAALGCRLDDLFSLEPVATVAAELVGDPEAVAVTGRVALARVGARTIARPLDGSSGVQHGLVGADGLVVARQGGRVTARLLTERELEE
ncbi:MAG: helix-turn-helix domain-containing protein, partial [Chloroflexi bacterium]|nr:helix-turn-helix domain-containing protein [Chloroflexota bacterium]